MPTGCPEPGAACSSCGPAHLAPHPWLLSGCSHAGGRSSSRTCTLVHPPKDPIQSLPTFYPTTFTTPPFPPPRPAQARLAEAQAASARAARLEGESAELVRRIIEMKDAEAHRLNELNRQEAETVCAGRGWRVCGWAGVFLSSQCCPAHAGGRCHRLLRGTACQRGCRSHRLHCSALKRVK
jgi:hypothetical protein